MNRIHIKSTIQKVVKKTRVFEARRGVCNRHKLFLCHNNPRSICLL